MTTDPNPDSPLEAADILDGTVIDVAGIAVRLHASDLRRAEAVAGLFRHADLSLTRLECSLDFIEQDVDIPTSNAVNSLPGVELWRPTPGQLLIRSSEGLTARSTAKEIVVGGHADSLARVFRHVCLLALTHLVAQHGRYLLHAGAVVTGDNALLILGNTGTGKSTLVFSAYRLGWPVLSDDVVSVRRNDGRVLAHGLPRPISVPDDVFAEPIPGGRLVPDDLRNRTELPRGTLTTSTHPVAGVILTAAGERPRPTLDPLEGHETLRQVLQACVSLADPNLRPELFAIAGALARLPAWSIGHGSNPSSALEDAGQQLGKIDRLLRLGPDVSVE